MLTFLESLRNANIEGDWGRTPIRTPTRPPAVAPAQNAESPETKTPTVPKEETPGVSSFTPPSLNTSEGLKSTLHELGLDPISYADALKTAQTEMGEYGVQAPKREDYKTTNEMTPGIALGLLLGGGQYLGSAMEGYTGVKNQQAQRAEQAQKDYLAAQQGYQQGKQGWQKDILQSARDAVNARRGEITSLAPYALLQQGEILRAQSAAHAAGLKYLTTQAATEYRYFALSQNKELKQAQLAIQQRNSEVRQAYDQARIAIEQGNQAVARERLTLLQQATTAKIQQEQQNTALLKAKIVQIGLKEAGQGFDNVSKEIETTINEINQMVGSQSPANQYLIDGLNVHLQQLIQQRDLYNTRLQTLQQQLTQTPAAGDVGGQSTPPPGYNGTRQTPHGTAYTYPDGHFELFNNGKWYKYDSNGKLLPNQ